MVIRNSSSEKIETLLKEGLIIFCGAGISAKSGIPLSRILIPELIDKLSSRIIAKRFKSAVCKLPLEILLDTLKNNSDISELLNVFVNSQPNRYHQMITELAKRGIVKTIVTTNFDTLIEQAFENSGLLLGKDYFIYSDEEDFSKYVNNGSDNRIVLIKIHGTINKPESIRTTMKEIANSSLSKSRARVLRSIFGQSDMQVLVIGYSFSDNMDINPILSNLKEPVSRVTVIQHSVNNMQNFEFKDEFEISVSKILRNFKFEIIKENTNQLVNCILLRLGLQLTMDFTTKSELNWKEFVSAWNSTLSKHVRSLIELELARNTTFVGLLKPYCKRLKRQLPSMENDKQVLLNSLNVLSATSAELKKYGDAEYYMEKLREFISTDGKHVEFAFYIGMGNIRRERYDLDKARQWYQKAYELSISIGCPNNVILASKNLAHLELVKGEFNSSQFFANEAFLQAERSGVQIEYNIYQDVGAAIFYTGSVVESIQLRETALENARITGQKKIECINSVSLSSIYLWRHTPPSVEDFEKSLELSKNSLKLAFEVGDSKLRAISHMNLANDYFFQYLFKKGFWHMITSYLQAKYINDPEISAATSYNLGLYLLFYLRHKRIDLDIPKRLAKYLIHQAFETSKQYGLTKQLEFYAKNLSESKLLPSDIVIH